MAKNCLTKLLAEAPDIHKYLKDRVGFDYDPATKKGRDEYIQAAKELQQHSVNTVKDVFNQIGIKGFETQTAENKIVEPLIVEPSVSINKNEESGTKVADKEGNPLVVYHGTKGGKPIEQFDESKISGDESDFGVGGFYFAANKNEAFGNDNSKGEYHVDIKNPASEKDVEAARAEYNKMSEEEKNKYRTKGGGTALALRKILMDKSFDGFIPVKFSEPNMGKLMSGETTKFKGLYFRYDKAKGEVKEFSDNPDEFKNIHQDETYSLDEFKDTYNKKGIFVAFSKDQIKKVEPKQKSSSPSVSIENKIVEPSVENKNEETDIEKRLFDEGGDLYNKINEIKKNYPRTIDSGFEYGDKQLAEIKDQFKPVIDEIRKATGSDVITLYRANQEGGNGKQLSSWTSQPFVAETFTQRDIVENGFLKSLPKRAIEKRDVSLDDVVAIKNIIYGEGFFTKDRSSQYEFIVENKPKLENKEAVSIEKPTVGNEVIENKEAEIKKINEERDAEIKKVSKPDIKLDFVTTKDLINSKDPVRSKEKHDAIKDKFKELRKILDCL